MPQEPPPQGQSSRGVLLACRSRNRIEEQAAEESPECANVPLDSGLVLSLVAERALDEDDLRVIRMAAAPLIEILKLRGLIGIGPPQPRKGDAR